MSGEDATVETGASLGYEIRPIRKKFELLVRGSEAERMDLASARGDGDGARAGLAHARDKTEEAKAVIEGREKSYRFDVDRLTAAYENPTFYPFGYLRQAHTQCLWRRRDEFARLIIEEGVLDSTSDVPRCLE